MHKIVFVIGFLIAIGFFAITLRNLDHEQLRNGNLPETSSESVQTNGVSLTLASGETMTLRIADSRIERVQGLSGVESLERLEGMLFLFEEPDTQAFWMKDMLMELDIIWIHDQEIVGFEKAVVPENPPETVYYSPVPVETVLEVNAGFVDEFGLEIGDILDIQGIEEYSFVE